VNFKGNKSRYIEHLIRDEDFRDLQISFKKANYEFMKNANEMMIMRK